MLIYLDMCCFNRPYDDQTQARIRFEAEAKMLIQQKVREGGCRLLWSSVLDFECSNNPYEDRQAAIEKWRSIATTVIMATPKVIAKANEFAKLGVGNYDSLHVAAAIAGCADLLVTTDDRLLKKMRGNREIPVMLPGEALAHLEGWYED